jgi:hypothetical protein
MRTRVLIIGPEERNAAAKLTAFALTSPFTPGPGVKAPGDDPRHSMQLGDFRCVFSFTRIDGKLYRHLSVGMLDQKAPLPNPLAVQEIAHLMGFEGFLSEWRVGVMRTHISILQPMDQEPAPTVIEA